MNLNLICLAEYYYQLYGYKLIASPWLVDEEINNLTKPSHRKNFYVHNKTLVGSAEQSFLQQYFDGEIGPGQYVTSTPCFRDEEVLDELHHQYFYKTELIVLGSSKKSKLEKVIDDAKEYFSQFIKVKTTKISNTEIDIVTRESNIELGSYGIRQAHRNGKTVDYIFGTGCAVPRLSQAIAKEKCSGYHENIDIPKTDVGSLEKISEEVIELQDASLQNNKVLILCELADIIGAIEHYLMSTQSDLGIEDLHKMSKLTQKAFANKVRLT